MLPPSVANAFTAGLLGGISFLDEVVEIGSKMARHLDDIDAADMVKAGRGLSHMDEALDAAKAGRYADEVADAAGIGRYADEALDAATANRLRNLDDFTGGNQAAKQSDELREALTSSSRRGSLSKRTKAAQAWAEAGANTNNPAIRRAINKGRGPIRGGSGRGGGFRGFFGGGNDDLPDKFPHITDRLQELGVESKQTREFIENLQRHFDPDELRYMDDALGGKLDDLVDDVECYGAALCVNGQVYGINIIPDENGFILRNTERSDDVGRFAKEIWPRLENSGVADQIKNRQLNQFMLRENFDKGSLGSVQ